MYHQSPTPEHEGLGRDVFFLKDIPDHSREVLKKVGKNHRSGSGLSKLFAE